SVTHTAPTEIYTLSLHDALPISRALPPKVDLRAGFTPCYNQGELGSCTANAIAGALEFLERKEGETPPVMPSRLFIYYNERALRSEEHTSELQSLAYLVCRLLLE